jgi:plastocyanin
VRLARVLLAVLLSAAAPALGAPQKPVPPARLLVVADEFSFTLSRASIKAGPAIIELSNMGEDPHDLTLRHRAKGARTYRLKLTLPEHERYLSARLVPGRYLLWCSVADHRQRGMEAYLTVKKR